MSPPWWGACVLAAALTLSASLAAQPPPALVAVQVSRNSGAESCPSAQDVVRRLEELFPQLRSQVVESPADTAVQVLIVVTPSTEGFSAAVVVQGDTNGFRRIDVRGADCAVLTPALAVTVALLRGDAEIQGSSQPLPEGVFILEPEAPADESGSGGQNPTATPPSTASTPPQATSDLAEPAPPALTASRDDPREASARHGGTQSVAPLSPLPLTLSVALAAGFPRVPAWGAALHAGIVHRSGVALAMTGWRFPSTQIQSDGGAISVDLWAASVGACILVRRTRAWGLLPCWEGSLGQQRGRSRNYLSNGTSGRRWATMGPGLAAFLRVSGPAYLRAGVSADLALGQRETFFVDGVEERYEQPVISGRGVLGIGVGQIP